MVNYAGFTIQQDLLDAYSDMVEKVVAKYPNDPLAATAAENIPLAYAKVGKTANPDAFIDAMGQMAAGSA